MKTSCLLEKLLDIFSLFETLLKSIYVGGRAIYARFSILLPIIGMVCWCDFSQSGKHGEMPCRLLTGLDGTE